MATERWWRKGGQADGTDAVGSADIAMKRIETIVSQIEGVETAADIGCDHGLIGRLLLEQGRAKRVIAVDVSAPSLQKAADMAARDGLAMETRLGDGLIPLGLGEAQAAVIAGMGGMLIRDILAARADVAEQMCLLVLAPNRNEAELRFYLRQNGFWIEREILAKERGKYYQIICTKFVGAAPEMIVDEAMEDEYGVMALRKGDPLLAEYLDAKLCQLDAVIQMARGGKQMEQYIEEMEQKRRWLEGQIKEARYVHNG